MSYRALTNLVGRNGSSLNAVCPYYTMYPLSFPFGVLARHASLARKGFVVDPFCGRGTTNFAARMLGLRSIGADSSPVAVALSKAKLAFATADDVVRCAEDILRRGTSPLIPSGEFWELAFHKDTLHEICVIREALLADCADDSRILLRAIVLGALHGPLTKRVPSNLSNQSPRTFAPKPRYAVSYWRKHELLPPRIRLLDVVRARADRYLADLPDRVSGRIIEADSRSAGLLKKGERLALAITSPPYFGMRTYLQDQWLRLWFLGGPCFVDYEHSSAQLSHASANQFAGQLRRVWANLAAVSRHDALLVIRFGGIHDRAVSPRQLVKESLVDSGWRISTLRASPDSGEGKRQVAQFHELVRSPVEEIDVYCRLG